MVGAQRALLESVASPSVRRFRGGSAWPSRDRAARNTGIAPSPPQCYLKCSQHANCSLQYIMVDELRSPE
jgi:hypothetical protein